VKAIGVLTTLTVTALAAYAAVLVVRSIPDIQRYLRIREM
jgi:hypothetical protein